uniref:Uncharacterized protein n=1 Tax=Anguilla anguilla TaxID=7936 RepID=A0A0E9UV62_ANGAN
MLAFVTPRMCLGSASVHHS